MNRADPRRLVATLSFALATLAGLALPAADVRAHAGEDHAPRPAATAPSGAASPAAPAAPAAKPAAGGKTFPGSTPSAAVGGPRFVAASDAFELVGALDGRRLVLWLDRAADNAPVLGATIELEIGGRPVAVATERDVYVATLDAPPAPGRVPVAATVTAGAELDVLATDWTIDPPASAAPAGADVATADGSRTVGIALAAALAAGALGWLAGRRRTAGAGEGAR